ncbi:hypothetical protein B0H15DRAFT_870292 [Mycena belliarum]|uniref:BTB domain-containing protein n=1 Tax=Mycena belliarum TaxID=1033014 RepID=A0AAD6TMP3_9AGAR|nr:hypothetical protein B0H15DRAFT_870292 [Mycena belliae]
MELDTETREPHHVQELWFEDGNLVIEAGTSRFRVYRGVLAARSPVFHDMLSFPQPPDAELVEGCPLVHLHDAEADVTVFLRAIYDSSFFMPYPVRTDFDSIAGCLRLSHKYGVDYLQRRALIHLSSGYYTNLADSDARVGNDVPTLNEISWNDPGSTAYCISAIGLAREVSALWILPYAFYSLSAAFKSLGMSIFHGTVYKGTQVNLSLEDQESFLNGYHIQRTSTTKDILRFLFHPADIPVCTDRTRCLEMRFKAFKASWDMLEDDPCIPLDIWTPDDWITLAAVCPACLAVLKRVHQDARQRFWDSLPEIYGLPSWKELEAMKVAAIGTDWLA